MKKILIFISRTSINFTNLCANLGRVFRTLPRRLAEVMERTLAPLRKIVSRTLEVYVYAKGSDTKPQSFVLHDGLECGHEQLCLGWDIFDLLNPYTSNPEVSAKRHRCRPCAQLLATRKPMGTVGVPAQVEVA